MTKISDFTLLSTAPDEDGYLHIYDTSAGENKKIKIQELIDDVGGGIYLIHGSKVTVSNAEVLALNTTPKQILGFGISPAYFQIYGVLVEYFFSTAAFTGDTTLVITNGTTEISARYDTLSNTSNVKLFMQANYYVDQLGNNAHALGVAKYITTPTSDPATGGGYLTATPIYRWITSF